MFLHCIRKNLKIMTDKSEKNKNTCQYLEQRDNGERLKSNLALQSIWMFDWSINVENLIIF